MRRTVLAMTIAAATVVAGCSPDSDAAPAPTALELDLSADDPAEVLTAVAVSPDSSVTATDLATAAELFVTSAAELPTDVRVDEASSSVTFTLDGRQHAAAATQVDGQWKMIVDPAPTFELVAYGWTLAGSDLEEGGGSLHLLPGVYDLQPSGDAAAWMTPSTQRLVVLPGRAPQVTWKPTEELRAASEAVARQSLAACSMIGCEVTSAFPGVDPASPSVTFPAPDRLLGDATPGGTNGDLTWTTAPVTLTGNAGGTVQGVARVAVDLRLAGSTWELSPGEVEITRD